MIRFAFARTQRAPLSILAVVLTVASCAANPPRQNADAAGTAGSTGTGGMGGGGSGGSGGPVAPTVLPVPPGPDNLPPPSGTPGNLKVLNWAGFKSAATYTFDDSQLAQIEHYADIQATGIRTTFYITTAAMTGASNYDATFKQAVKDGHEIGNHTVHHCHIDLTGCSNGSATSVDAELDDCNSYIISHFGQDGVWTAASPFGDTGWDTPDMSRFFINRGVGSGMIPPNASYDPFNLPIHAAVEGETAAMFNAAIDGAETAGSWVIFLVHTIGPTTQTWEYAQIDISVITDSVAHAKTLGDVWLDSTVNIGAYWRAQKVLSTVTPTSSGVAQTWTWTLPPHFPRGKILRVTFDGGTPSQDGTPLTWNGHGYYELELDKGSVTLSP
jgi:peptidoglycan/xylan/chitin deacetylase (PgdA/CDA1 family)